MHKLLVSCWGFCTQRLGALVGRWAPWKASSGAGLSPSRGLRRDDGQQAQWPPELAREAGEGPRVAAPAPPPAPSGEGGAAPVSAMPTGPADAGPPAPVLLMPLAPASPEPLREAPAGAGSPSDALPGTAGGSADAAVGAVPEVAVPVPAATPSRPLPAWVIPLESRRSVPFTLEQRVVVIGDCENDTASVLATLRFAGLLDKGGRFTARARGVQIVQTGDLLYKGGPSAAIARFWEGLRGAAAAAGCGLHLLAGNHEIEIWRRIEAGERLGLSREDQRSVQALIRSMALFHVAGTLLFLHGYPTLELLRDLRAYRPDPGRGLNGYNIDRFQRAFGDPRHLARYAYLRGKPARECLLYDLADPERYYRRHGREVSAVFRALGIEGVIHGHRPERSGLQRDYELRRWLPDVRMINNDIQLRLQGLGGTLIKQCAGRPTEMLFLNGANATLAHRTDIRQLLRAAEPPLGVAEACQQRPAELKSPGTVLARDFGPQARAVEAWAAMR